MRGWTLIIGALSLIAASCGVSDAADDSLTAAEGEGLGTVRFFDEGADDGMVSVTWPTFDDFGQLAGFSDVAFVGSVEGVVNDHVIDEGTELDPSGVSVIHDGIVFGIDQVIYASEQMSEIGDRVTIAQPVSMTGPSVGVTDDGLPLQEVLIRQEPIEYLREGLEAIAGAERPSYLIFARMGVYGDQQVLLFAGAAGIQRVVDGVVTPNGVSPFTESGLTIEFVERSLDEGSGPTERDGTLDCLTDETWSQQGEFDPSMPGESGTAAEVLQRFLAQYQQEYGLEVFEVIDGDVGVLVLDGREVVVAVVQPAELGGWIVPTLQSCGPYRPLD